MFTISVSAVMLPDAKFLSSRAQNRGFCAFLAFGTAVFGRFEHKIEVFVRFWPLEPSFSGISSTKSRFLCFFGLRRPYFLTFYITFFNILQQKALRSAYQEPSVCVQSFS